MPGRLAGKVALISGGARGMGACEARLFVAEGARVVLGDVLDAEGRAVAKQLGKSACYVPLDVTREPDWQAAVRRTRDQFGRLLERPRPCGRASLSSGTYSFCFSYRAFIVGPPALQAYSRPAGFSGAEGTGPRARRSSGHQCFGTRCR